MIEMDDKTIRVLLIEDSAGDARLIREMLAEAGTASVQLEHVDRLSTGLERLAQGDIHVVLLDLGLPDAQGLDTLVKTYAQEPKVPVVVLTGLDDEALAVNAVQEGAQDYLVKGQIEGNQLVRAMRYAIERKRLDEALRASEERLRAVITSAPVVLFATDREGVLTLSEGRGLAALGLRPGESEGGSVFDMYRGTPEIGENMRRALAGEAFAATVEVGALAFETHYAPLREDAGRIGGVIGVATDITERKLAEDELRQTVAALERKTTELESFTYSVSHDLKEPLRTLEAFSQFLLEDYARQLDGQGQDYLRRIGKASARLKQMIEDLLLLSRLGRRPESVTRVALQRLLAEIVAALEATIEEKGARVSVADGLPDVLGDHARIEQIFGNLVANGLKFNRSAEPVVEIGLRGASAAEATFFVRDNGIGIAPEYHEQIFGPFQRLHRREEYEGTGAGLAIVKLAVQSIGGEVWVESEAGAGATFFIKLPLWQRASAPPSQELAIAGERDAPI